jgi:hypothetical protein
MTGPSVVPASTWRYFGLEDSSQYSLPNQLGLIYWIKRLVGSAHVFRFLVHPLEIVHVPFDRRRYSSAWYDEFDVHYRGVMSWLSSIVLSTRNIPLSLLDLGLFLFTAFYRRANKKFSKTDGTWVTTLLTGVSFSEIVDRHDGFPDEYILDGSVIPHSTYLTNCTIRFPT